MKLLEGILLYFIHIMTFPKVIFLTKMNLTYCCSNVLSFINFNVPQCKTKATTTVVYYIFTKNKLLFSLTYEQNDVISKRNKNVFI